MKNSLIVKGFIVSTLLLSGCSESPEEKPQMGGGVVNADAFRVVEEPFTNEMSTTASLLANEQVELMAPIGGQVLKIYFKEGQFVQKGTPIIRLDDRSWKAQLTGLNAQLDVAKKNHERKIALLKIEGASQQEVDELYSNIQLLQSQIDNLKVNINLANVTAPFSGTLGMRNFSVGTYFSQGDPITSLTDKNHLKVDFNIPQEYISGIAEGQKVKVLVNGDRLQSVIYAISPVVDQTSATVNIRALLEVDSKQIIVPGTYAEVLVSTGFNGSTLFVPTQAVVPEINDQTVYLYKSGKAVRVKVQIGSRTADKVIVMNGIAKGDTVLTTGLMQIKEGMDIKLLKVD